MKIKAIVWLPNNIDKLEAKHGVSVDEVEDVFDSNPLFRRGPRGKRKRENLHKTYGQSRSGRYLFVVFIYKANQHALILSARDMTYNERQLYRRG